MRKRKAVVDAMSVLLLAIDIGTSGCKVALFDEKGREIGVETENYHLFTPKAGFVEQDPEEWWKAVCVSCKRLIQKTRIEVKDIAGIGVDGQSWSAIPIDVKGKVLRRTPIWMDVRSDEICKKYSERIGIEHIFQVAGNPFSPSYTLPKILYFMEYEPELIRQTDKFLQSNSFIAYRLTGVISQDLSQSYGYHNFNQHTLEYDMNLTKEMGVPQRFLLDMVPSHRVIGYVKREAAEITGLQEGTPVVAGGLDAACSTLGVGVIQEGQVQEQGGQAGGMSICTSSALAHPGLILSPHVVEKKWLLQGGTVAGGASLNWFAGQFGSKDAEGISLHKQDLFKKLSAEAEQSKTGANGVIFLPYLNGERSPVWDTQAVGLYFGFGIRNEHRDFARATMEGVAFSLRHNLETAKEVGADIREMYATGGSAESSVWTQIKADVTGFPIHVPKAATSTVWGTAILAGIGTGVFKDAKEAVNRSITVQRSHYPRRKQTDIYGQYFEIYKELYIQTKSSMHKLRRLDRTGREG